MKVSKAKKAGNAKWNAQAVALRTQLILDLSQEQDFCCALTGVRGANLELHEWLVPRSKFPFKDERQLKLFSRENCILIDHAQHARSDYNTLNLECALWAINKYGKDQIDIWLESCRFRTGQTFGQWLYSHAKGVDAKWLTTIKTKNRRLIEAILNQ